MTAALLPAEPFATDTTEAMVAQFHREGFLKIGPMLTPDEVAALNDAIDRKLADPAMSEDNVEGDHRRGISLMRMFEYDRAFRDLIVREPMVSLAEAILGRDCHVISANTLANARGEGVTGWHVDDRVLFPTPEGVEQHDPRIRIPCFIANFMVALTDMDELQYGPSQVVPGSHYSGRNPPPVDNPTFNGRGPESIFAKAGEAYCFHNQLWHRGAPNTSDRVRHLGSVVYGQRTIAQRFYPFIDYRMPEHVWEGADERLQRLLGRHPKGAYG